MEFYILKSGICLVIFYGFYKLVLEKESFHVFKRYYLLVSAVLAFVIPLITFTEYIEVIPQEVPLFFPESSITHTVIEAEPINYIPIILWSIYGLGVLLFSFKFLKNLSGIIFRIKRNPKFKNQSFINVLLQDLVIPHTFLSYIFLNKHKFETQQIPKEVLLHEETHAKQKHSLDVLFIEILQILFWFNPLIYFIKHSIKLNHEFLADQAVINNGFTPSAYQQILLAFSSNASEPQLANAINYSSIKKRFTVMKTQTSKQAFWLRSLILLPLLALLIYSFSEKKVVEKPQVVQLPINEKGASETLMNEYKSIISAIEATNKIWSPSFNRAVIIYDMMTDSQRATVKKYPDIPNPMLSRMEVKPKTPTEAEFNSWKDSNKFAIWIDGTHLKNTELNKYKASDIKYFANSFVYNNARSDKFPQSYQNHLYTQKGFEETYLKSNAKKYNSLKTEYLKVIEENTISSDELKILKAQLDRAFDNLTEEEIEKYNIIKETSIITSITKPNQQKATPEEIEEYNKLAKQYNSQPENSRVVKLKDLERLENIYSKMTKEQKASSEAFPNLPPPPPPPMMEPKNPSEKLIEIRNTYVENAKAYGLARQNFYKNNIGNASEVNKLKQSMMTSYNEYSDLAKEELKSSKDLKKQDFPPPPPPTVSGLPQNPSKELLEAKKKYWDEAETYGAAMDVYFKEKKGNTNDLKKQYNEVMELYNAYKKLEEKENVLPPPPPPPAPAPAKKQ